MLKFVRWRRGKILLYNRNIYLIMRLRPSGRGSGGCYEYDDTNHTQTDGACVLPIEECGADRTSDLPPVCDAQLAKSPHPGKPGWGFREKMLDFP